MRKIISAETMKMFRKMFVYFLLIMGSAKGKLIINGTVKGCIERPFSLSCDFKDSDHEEVYLYPLDRQLKTIYVQHIKKLHLAESVCANVNFFKISEIVTEGDKNEHCEDGLGLLALNSSLHKLPENVKTVSLTFSSITVLASNKNLEKLTITKSEIATLSISGPFKKNPYIELQGSRIVRTEQLVLEDGAELIVRDSIFEDVIKNSIVLSPSISLTLENVHGHLLYTIHCKNENDSVFSAETILIVLTIVLSISVLMLAYDKFKLKRCHAKSRDNLNDNSETFISLKHHSEIEVLSTKETDCNEKRKEEI